MKTYLERGKSSPFTIFSTEDSQWDIEFVDNSDDADVNILWLIPKGKSLFQSDGSPLHVNLSDNGIDVARVNKMTAQKPTVLVLNYTNPWAIDEIYTDDSKNIQGVLATFGTTPEAILDIVTGKFNPSGKMPFTTPISDEEAQNQKSDVPGYMEGPSYGLFHFDEGLSF
ncbi:glycoside hydrolase family 3 C-terminal domain-containing protein [Winogradskyella maritima]|nr:glycoside hydrolase family 3 C-terminal domain-containing protein [Winogradskyella maritima]